MTDKLTPSEFMANLPDLTFFKRIQHLIDRDTVQAPIPTFDSFTCPRCGEICGRTGRFCKWCGQRVRATT